MPLVKARKGASKKAKRKALAKNFHTLKNEGFTGKQRIAIALSAAGLSNKKRKKRGK